MNHETTLIWYDPTRMVTFRASFYGNMAIRAHSMNRVMGVLMGQTKKVKY